LTARNVASRITVPEVAKAMPARYGISLARDMGHDKVELKIDSFLVTMAINKAGPFSRSVAQDIRI
jgi:3D (Asp-Asp-Asp) domain-containing protein